MTDEIRDWLYTGGWDHVTQCLLKILERKATADEDTILVALERMKEAEWKATPDMSMFHFPSFHIFFFFYPRKKYCAFRIAFFHYLLGQKKQLE